MVYDTSPHFIDPLVWWLGLNSATMDSKNRMMMIPRVSRTKPSEHEQGLDFLHVP